MNVNADLHFIARSKGTARSDSERVMLRVLAIDHKHIRIFSSNAKQYAEQNPEHRIDKEGI
jgi:hypothetical protein